MRTWKIEIVKPKFAGIKSGGKTIETRAPDPSRPDKHYNSVQKGDLLVFVCEGEEITKEVTGVRLYKPWQEMFDHENLSEIQPETKSRQEAIEIYYGYPGYRQRLEKYGIIAIYLK